jgi:hypothetical protein
VHITIALPIGTAVFPKTEILYRDFAAFGRNSLFVSKPEFPDIGRQDYLYADMRDEIKKAMRR